MMKSVKSERGIKLNQSCDTNKKKFMDKQVFLHPEQEKSLGEAQAPLWFWNDDLKDDELLRQLELMSDAGVTANAPHARMGFHGGYLDESWMHSIKTVVDYKKAHQESMWIYDEFNWPAGVANGEVTKDETLREKFLLFERFEVPASTRFRRQLEPLVAVRANMEDYFKGGAAGRPDFNVFCYDAETMEQLPLAGMMPESGNSRDVSMRMNDFELFRDRDTIVITVRILVEPFHGEGALTPDYMDARAARKFVEVTYDAYYEKFPDAFGSVITAGFNDETRLCHAFPWSDQFAEEFKKRKGYDILKCLPDLILTGEKSGRTRCDYFDVVADLYRENYHGVIHSWCRAHGIDYMPHLLGEECMAGHTRFSGDYMRQTKAMDRPGVDHLGKGIGSLNAKFASSAADAYGKEGLVCEVFAGCGWDLSFEEYLRMVSWLYSQGVKTITNHGFFYSIRDFRQYDWPPSEFFQWAHWDKMPLANAMTRRMYGMLTGGVSEAETLVYHPIESFWLHYIADQGFTHGYHMGPIIGDARAMEIDHKEQLLLSGLQEKNAAYSILPSDAIDNFTVKGRHMINRLTGQVYTAVVLPMCEVLPLKAALLFDAFARQGGQLCLMENYPALAMKKAEDAQVRNIFENMKLLDNVHFIEDAADVDHLETWLTTAAPAPIHVVSGRYGCKNNHPSYPDYIIDPYMHTGEDLDGVGCTRYLKDGHREYFFVNYTSVPQKLSVRVPSLSAPEVWDCFTGEIYAAEILEDGDGRRASDLTEYTVSLTLPPHYGTFLVTEI